jgi:hypothetical protein
LLIGNWLRRRRLINLALGLNLAVSTDFESIQSNCSHSSNGDNFDSGYGFAVRAAKPHNRPEEFVRIHLLVTNRLLAIRN